MPKVSSVKGTLKHLFIKGSRKDLVFKRLIPLKTKGKKEIINKGRRLWRNPTKKTSTPSTRKPLDFKTLTQFRLEFSSIKMAN